MPLLIAVLLLARLISASALAPAASLSWQPWHHLASVFDLAGPRTDGQLVVAAGRSLFLMSPNGAVVPFANGPGGYQVPAGPEAYLDVSTGHHVSGANCDFIRDDVFIIRPTAPMGITRVDAQGHASNFATIKGLDTLNGIAFDTVGRFDHRLLVTGPHNSRTTVLAIDCKGGIVTITGSAPPLEGGFALAPSTFGTHGGELVAPDESTGVIVTISATGQSGVLIQSAIPHGGDIGVESAAFVPPGFSAGGTAYVADRGTPGNPHPGTDNILRMSSSDMVAAGVREGDLVVAAEGGAVTVDVRCGASCVVKTIVPTGTTAHIEGHVVMVANPVLPTPTPSASLSPLPTVTDLGSQRSRLLSRVAIGLLVVLAALAAVILFRRDRRG